MNKKRILIPLVIILAVTALIAGIAVVNAFMFKKSQELTNNFIVAEVACEVNEKFENNQKSNVTVQNTGDTEAYIRLRIVSYWQDSKGNAIFDDEDSNINIGTLGDGWIEGSDNTYYYTKPVKEGESTPALFTGTITLNQKEKKVNEVVYTYNQVVEIIAEAIQSEPANAVQNSWNVTVSDGTITP